MNVLIINGSMAYANMWKAHGHKIVNTFANADVIQFTGGEDVTPSMYGEAAHKQTYNSEVRDKYELQYYQQAVADNIPVVGICRGGQFLNVVNGGKMYQHVNNHAIGGTHSLIDLPTGVVHHVTSTHHQMMRAGPSGEVVAIAHGRSEFRENMIDGKLNEEYGAHDDVEVVFYEDTKSLCFQPHPEFNCAPCAEYFFKLVERHLNIK